MTRSPATTTLLIVRPNYKQVLKKDISVIENYSTVVVRIWGWLPLLAFGTCLSKIYNSLAVFESFRESLDQRLDLIYMIYDRITLGRLISRT